MLGHFSQASVARHHISFDDFLQVFISLVADFELRANVCANGFFRLDNINMDDVGFVELPGEREVVGAARGRTEVKLTIVLLFE